MNFTLEEISIREGLALFSAIALVGASAIADRRRRPLEALASAKTGQLDQQKAVERAKYYLRNAGWRNLVARTLALAGVISLMAAIVLYARHFA